MLALPRMAFIDLGDQFIALSEGAGESPDHARHVGLVVDDKEALRAALGEAGVQVRSSGSLRVTDPSGNQLEIVDYRDVQFTKADAVLHGEVTSIETVPLLFDATTGQVTAMIITVHSKASLTDEHTDKVVYENKDMVFREEYQISTDIPSFFEESAPALERMAHDYAARLVADLLEGF